MSPIETFNLSKTYYTGLVRKSKLNALEDVTLSVHPGEVFSLLGPNGAGKTTLIRLLLAIIFPTYGSARIFGKSVDDSRSKQRVGHLPENHRFPSFLTGEDVLGYFGALSGVDSATLGVRIEKLLTLVGMAKWRKLKVKNYSKGMLQRIGIAQALINDPDLIFLDEPTDGVDPIGRREIREILKRLRDEGKTIFLNSHLLSEVELISDRLTILHKGKIVRTGTVREFTTSASLYDLRFEGDLSAGVKEKLSANAAPVRIEPGVISFETEGTAGLNDVIDLLRAHRVPIVSVSPRKTSLEDYFIEIIREEPTA